MRAVVLEKKGEIRVREIDIHEELGPDDVRIAIRTVGICGSDVHYYEYGGIGPFVVKEPMVLGHEAAGEVVERGVEVEDLKVGDRVCMEPGIPNSGSREARLGMYNLDPDVRFWATPPVHGCLRPTVVHPAAFTYKLPDNVSVGEGALVEPLAVGMHASQKARIKPGAVAVVTGAGTIGTVTAMAALAGGCSIVIISDVQEQKLELVGRLDSVEPVNVTKQNLSDRVMELTEGWGADILFEASGNAQVVPEIFESLCPGGAAVFIGIPVEPVVFDIVAAQAKEIRMETVFRYAHVYPLALALMESGKIDVRPLITDEFSFDDAIKAFDFAQRPPPDSVKVQILLDQ